jgi:hypothetical protein
MKIHSPPSIAEVKNEWSYTSIPAIRLHGVDRNNFTFSYSCEVPQASLVLMMSEVLR